MHACATPGGDSGYHGDRAYQRPSQVELFARAGKCKDTKKLCAGSVSTGRDGLKDASIGFKRVEKGSREDIYIPPNYFCLVTFKSD